MLRRRRSRAVSVDTSFTCDATRQQRGATAARKDVTDDHGGVDDKRDGASWLDAQQERLWTQRKFTDAEVVVGTSRFAVHRATLAAASPIFAAAFESSSSVHM